MLRLTGHECVTMSGFFFSWTILIGVIVRKCFASLSLTQLNVVVVFFSFNITK